METLAQIIEQTTVSEKNINQTAYTCHIGRVLSQIKENGVEWFAEELQSLPEYVAKAAYLHVVYEAMAEVSKMKSREDLVNLEKIAYLLNNTRPLTKHISRFDEFSQIDFWSNNVFFTNTFNNASIREADFNILIWFMEYLFNVEHSKKIDAKERIV